VVCDTQKKYVIGLLASGLYLSGLIPESTIGKLSKLQSLDLSNNKITGFLSNFWSLGRSFKTLNLSYNHIFGSLPSNIGNFGGWESLDLSFNSFSGVILASFSSLSGLQVLKLDGNGFGGSIPVGILKWQNLVLVSITSNQITGTVPDGFSIAFPKLKNLDISGNAIQGWSLDIFGMKSITYLNISMNLFEGSVMGVFEAPLEVIDLSQNQFHGHISQMKKLQRNLNMNCSKCPHYGEPSYIFGSGGARGTANEMDMEFLGEVWNWFQNKRYATKSKLVKSPDKLSVSPLPQDDSVPMRNAPHFVPGPVPMHVPALPENLFFTRGEEDKMTRFEGESQSTTEKGKHDVQKAPSFSGPLMLPNKASSNSYSVPIRSSGGNGVRRNSELFVVITNRRITHPLYFTGFCSFEDKLKANLVQVKGCFSITSENMDHAKGLPLRKYANVGDWLLDSKQVVKAASEREQLLLQKILELQTRMININGELTAEKLKHMRCIVLCDSKLMGKEPLGVKATGVIMVDDNGDFDVYVVFPLAASMLDMQSAEKISSYINSTRKPEAYILKSGSLVDTDSPVIPLFSSRGPNDIT
ncbi:hypothetical protein GIB67_020493, partial [Kingdonia uniflora]